MQDECLEAHQWVVVSRPAYATAPHAARGWHPTCEGDVVVAGHGLLAEQRALLAAARHAARPLAAQAHGVQARRQRVEDEQALAQRLAHAAQQLDGLQRLSRHRPLQALTGQGRAYRHEGSQQ